LSVPYPASVASGDLILLFITNKYPNNFPATPTNFIFLNRFSGGTGTGIDIGAATISVFYRVATGALTGNIAVTITSGNSAIGRAFRYTKDPTKSWGFQIGGGINLNPGTTSCGFSPTPTVDLLAGDAMVAGFAVNGDLYNVTAASISFPFSATFNQRQNSGTANGQDCLLAVYDYVGAITTPGTVTTVLGSASGSNLANNQPDGAGALVVLREVDAPSGFDPYGMMGFYGM